MGAWLISGGGNRDDVLLLLLLLLCESMPHDECDEERECDQRPAEVVYRHLLPCRHYPSPVLLLLPLLLLSPSVRLIARLISSHQQRLADDAIHHGRRKEKEKRRATAKRAGEGDERRGAER